MRALDPHPSVPRLAPFELPASTDHGSVPVQPSGDASVIDDGKAVEPWSDPEADRASGVAGSLDREPNARGLGLGHPETGCPLGSRQADEFDDPRSARADEVERDVDLPESDFERIWSAGSAQPRPDI